MSYLCHVDDDGDFLGRRPTLIFKAAYFPTKIPHFKTIEKKRAQQRNKAFLLTKQENQLCLRGIYVNTQAGYKSKVD